MNPIRRTLFIVAAVSVALVPGRIAAVPQHEHTTHADDLIDGSKNPELIPDATAYRLFFVAASRAKAQQALLTSVGLGEQDSQGAARVLADFGKRYAALIEEYNQSSDKSQAALSAFYAKRDALVQATRDALSVAVSADGVATLHNHIQGQKFRMKVAREAH